VLFFLKALNNLYTIVDYLYTKVPSMSSVNKFKDLIGYMLETKLKSSLKIIYWGERLSDLAYTIRSPCQI
jgi:hypothetical protein